MRIRLLTTLMPGGVALAFASVLPARLAGQSCKPASETTAASIGRLTYWITVTDPAEVTLRDTKFKIPVVPTKQLVVAADSKICSKAAQAYAAEFARTPSTGSTRLSRSETA